MVDFFSAMAHYVKDGNSDEMSSFVSDSTELHKLAIFRNTFLSSCIDALKGRFPSCVAALGEEYFHQIARDYVQSHTPASKMLNAYGADMPSFILNAMEGKNLDYLADLATLDNTWNHVYFAETVVPPTEQDLARWMENIDSVTLVLSNCATLVSTNWSVSTIWSQLKDGPLSSQCTIEPIIERTLMWRDAQGVVLHRTLSEEEFIFIAGIQSGNSLTDAADDAAKKGEIDISFVFSQLITNQLLVERVDK